MKYFILTWLLFFGCQHQNDLPENADPLKQLREASPSTEEANIAQEEEVDDVWALDEDGDFCADDVYTTHLRKQYFRKNKDKSRRYRNRRSRRLYKARREVNATYYARKSLVGTLPDYFGELPVTMNEKVEYWVQYFKTRGRQTFLKWLVRAASISDTVGPLLEEEKMPKELFFLAMIESGFNFRARSRARAMGPWQFMYGTS